MSLETATNFKAAIALAAVQLNAAMKDTSLAEIASEIRRPTHPLRKLRSLFNLNPKTGVWTSNDAYIDSAYAGRYPNASNRPEMSVTDLVPITLTTATVEDGGLDDIVLTFNRNIAFAQNVSVGGDHASPQLVTGIAIVDNVVTVTVTEAYLAADTITLTGLFIFDGISLQLTAEAVTNNITP